MPDQPDLSTFQRRLAERRAREEAAEKAKQQHPSNGEFDPDLIPEAVHSRSEDDLEMDKIINGIDIITAYAKWCGKMVPDVTKTRTEGIMISCPIPGHVDSDPSAWVNTEKQVWHCGGCNAGGDKYDIAAYAHGMSTHPSDKDYKNGANFHRLREKMAEDFGYTISTTPSGATLIIPPEEEKEERPEPPDAEVINLHDEDFGDESDIPTLDWRPICPENTFLDEYMKATVIDDVPEEYHFFHALIALGFALGRDVSLFDSVPVYANLFVCTLGRSGTGKSKARRHLDQLLERALPYDHGTATSRGVLKVNAPGSAENLIHQFMKPQEDPANPKRIIDYLPVRGLIDFNELSSLVARSKRMGSAMTPTLMQFYDMETVIQTSSMTTGSKIAKQPFASALTTSQPRALRGLIDATDDASGFLNRWLFIPGREKKRFSVGGVEVDMSGAVLPLQRVQGWAATFGPERVEWSEEAYMAFDNWFHSTLEPIKKSSSNDLLVRIDLTMKKLILLFSANRLEKVVSKQSVLDALYCFPYLKAAYGIPEAQIGNTINNEISEVIITQVDKYKDGITASKLWDNIKHRKYDKKRVLDVLTTLTKMGLIEEVKVNAGRVGRPTVRYRNVG